MSIKRIANTLQDAAASAGAVAKRSALATAGAVSGVPGQLAGALPDKSTLKAAVGGALVTGGKLLIDPKAVLGEAAVRMGENLRADPARIRCFVVVFDEAGAAQAFPFVDPTQARAFFDAAWQEHRRAYLCDVCDGPR